MSLEDEGWVLHEGDCMRILPFMDSESADAFVTDPPYGISNQISTKRDKTDRFEKIANDERPFIWWLNDAYRITKEGGHLICFCRWDVQDAFRLAIEWAGWRLKGQVIWDRGIHGVGDLNGSFAPQHDVIWHATKGKGQLYGVRPKSVISVQRLQGDQLNHPNEKPIPLMRYLIRAVTKPGNLVVEPFAGSGATMEAALIEQRKVIGCEISPGFCNDIRGRLMVGHQPELSLW